jgi:phosphatidylethanolamine-binding protein (PEBP) family uncharacterized protein
MKFKTLACLTFVLVAALMIPWSNARADGKFRLSSTTFANKATLPLSTIDNILQNGVNICSINGSPGGDQSPELSWSSPPIGTRSFVVVLYDVTAAFTHWGMYNISRTATGLPENAGVAGSMYGDQIVNDFSAAEYDPSMRKCTVAGFTQCIPELPDFATESMRRRCEEAGVARPDERPRKAPCLRRASRSRCSPVGPPCIAAKMALNI